MKVQIHERDKEFVIFFDAETLEEANQILRISANMNKPNAGYSHFSGKSISGWISVPKKAKATNTIKSGAW